MSSARRLRLLGALFALTGAAAVLAAPSAGASGGAQDPPGWADPGGGAWVAFSVSPTTVAPIGRSANYPPVTITRDAHLGSATLEQAFPGWPSRDTNGDGIPDELGWPDSFSGGGVSLTRVAWCPASSSQCEYQLGDPGPFFFAGGTPAVLPDGSPDYSAFDSFKVDQLSKLPSKQIVATLTYTKGGPGELGKLTLDGSGSTDPAFPGAALSFTWTITSQDPNNPKIWTGTGPILTQAIVDPGTYCIDLAVVSSGDGSSMPAGQQCITFTDGEVPAKPVNSPGGGGGTTAPAPSDRPIASIVFAKPTSNVPAALGGGASSPTVVWLWRPDFYQSGPQNQPRSGGRPELRGGTEILAANPGAADGANAGPWLGGLVAFGVLGAGFILSRRRRLRLEP